MTATSRALDRVPDAVRGFPGLWVVGGAVRDALLGREPRELDLLVEGDAGAVARALGEPAAMHERFGTYTVAGIDVAAARRETYARPGALPDVELGATIAEDLARRDFTVNAIAVRVSDCHVEAFEGALEDLEGRVLRFLHERSFVDDPTRVLRLARYSARLGFTVEPETARAAEAVDFGTVSGTRVGAELRLAQREPPAVWAELARWGVPLQGFAVPPFVEQLTGLAALGACLLDAENVAGQLDRLGFSAAERSVVAAAAGARSLAARLAAAATPSEVAHLAAPQPEEALAVAAALGAGAPVERWLAEWRHVRPAITGDDLVAAGLSGAAVGTGLRAALGAALDEGADREAQLAAALGAAR